MVFFVSTLLLNFMPVVYVCFSLLEMILEIVLVVCVHIVPWHGLFVDVVATKGWAMICYILLISTHIYPLFFECWLWNDQLSWMGVWFRCYITYWAQMLCVLLVIAWLQTMCSGVMNMLACILQPLDFICSPFKLWFIWC